MFTIKYRCYDRAPAQPAEGPTNYNENEQLHGPFDVISKEQDEDGYTLVHGHYPGELSPCMTFGPFKPPETAGEYHPRPTLWVMNESGATVARYDI